MKILTSDHIIKGNEYFRQKRFCPYDSDNFAVNTAFLKWTSIRYLVSDVWKNRALKELDRKDEHYPHSHTFLQSYEFIEFENDEEKKLVEISSDKEVRSINKRLWLCYRLWNDWTEHYLHELNKEQIEKLKHAKLNQCPCCHVGEVVEKTGRYGKFRGCTNFPNCKYIEDHLNDSYFSYQERKKELILIKSEIERLGL